MRTMLLAALWGTSALVAVTAAQAQTPAPQPGATSAPGAAAGTTAGSVNAGALRNQPVFNSAGQEIGRIGSVVIGPENQASMVISGGTFGNRQVLVPANRLAYQNNRLVATGYSEEQLRAMPAYTAGAAGYRNAEDSFALNVTGYTATAQAGQGGEAARIVVQQPAPAIQVQQSSPQVQVTQAQPNVTVRQAQPEIIVRQPAPRVTVDIPQPEIIVRMPQPEVNVAQAQPQVEVRQAQPQVQVVQPEQPQVNVTAAQPNVQVQQQGTQANVQVQQAEAQPQVRYERAEPQVTVNQAQGQPEVRVEQAQPGQPAPAAQPQQQATATPPARPAEPQTTAAVNPTAPAAGQPMPVSRVVDMDLYSANNEQLGDIERMVQTQDGKQHVIVSTGGFLGLGGKQVAIPVERVAMRGDRLVVEGMTNDQIRALPAFDRNATTFRQIEESAQVPVRVIR